MPPPIVAKISEIRKGIANNLATIAGIEVYDYAPAQVSPPFAVVGGPLIWKYDAAMKRGADDATFPVLVGVGSADDEEAQRWLDELLDPTDDNAVKAAIESDKTLNSKVNHVRVSQARDYGQYEVGGGLYFGVMVEVEVMV